MQSRLLLLLLSAIMALMICPVSLNRVRAADKPKTEIKKPKANVRDYKKRVQPFLKEHCYKCHSGETKKKDLDLEKIEPNMIKGKDAEKWQTVFERLRAKEMPPEKEPRPDEKKQDRVLKWITDELEKAELEKVPEKK